MLNLENWKNWKKQSCTFNGPYIVNTAFMCFQSTSSQSAFSQTAYSNENKYLIFLKNSVKQNLKVPHFMPKNLKLILL